MLLQRIRRTVRGRLGAVVSLFFTVLVVIIATACGKTGPVSGTPAESQQPAGLPPGYPSRPVEFVVPFNPGGGSDIFARTIAEMIRAEGLVRGTINVFNRPGGSGATGMAYVAGKRGDNYTLMTMVNDVIAGPIQSGSEISYKNLTPIARLSMDQFLIIVHADSPYKTVQDLVKAAKESPRQINFAGTGIGAPDSLLLALFEKATGTKFNYISFESGGEVNTALLGKQVDVATANPTEVISLVEAGQIRALAVAGEQRLRGLPDVPTLKESGIDVVFEQFRGVAGPPNMDPAVVEFWADVFKRLSESDRWQREYVDVNMQRSAFLGPAEFRSWLDEMDGLYRDLMRDLGLVQE